MTSLPTFWASSARSPDSGLHDAFTERLNLAVSSERASSRGVDSSAREKQHAASEWFLECLYQGFCCLPSAAVALPRSVSAYSTNRLDALPYGYDVVTRVWNAAKTLGWITVTLGFDGGDRGLGKVTRVQAVGELLEHFHLLGIQWQEVDSPPVQQLIVLGMGEKGKARRLADRAEDEQVPAMQDNLHRINEFLLSQCIHLNCSNKLLLDQQDGPVSQGDVKAAVGRYNPKDRPRALNFQNVAMRRIFTHGSFDKG